MHNLFLIFDMSGGELILIVLAIIILFGPKQIPVIARTIGKVMYEVRTASNQIKQEVMAEAQKIEKAVGEPQIPKTPETNNNPVDNELHNSGSETLSPKSGSVDDVKTDHTSPDENPVTS